MERKSALKLTSKVHTGYGILSFILGLLSIICLIVAIIVSAFYSRERLSVQYVIGFLEAASLIISVCGIAFGAVGETTKETFKLFAHLGLGVNGVAMVFHILILIFAY